MVNSSDRSISPYRRTRKAAAPFVALNQLAGLLNSLWRTETVVVAEKHDFATINATFVVDLFEICGFGLADRAEG